MQMQVGRMSRAHYAIKAVESLKAMSRRFWFFNWHNGDLAQAVECHLRVIKAIVRADDSRPHSIR